MLASFACGGARQPPPGLTVVLETSAVTLDPHRHAHTATAVILHHFYDALVGFGPDMQIRPSLAESWENPSETVWRFHLRRGVVFHDGRLLGAEDVAASLQRAMGPDCAASYLLQRVAEVRAVGALEVEIVTRAPSLALLNKLVYVPIVPRDAPAVIEVPVGTGPYRFVARPSEGVIEARRFERFWGDPAEIVAVSLVTVPDDDERAEAIVAGTADIVYHFPRKRWQWGLGQPSMQLRSGPDLGVVMAVLSVAEGSPFADARLRQAVMLAVDRRALVEEALGGLGAPAHQLVSPAVTGYASDLPNLASDRVEAARLATEVSIPSGSSIALYTADTYASIVQVLVGQLAEVGIPVEPRILPQPAFYEKLTSEQLTMAVFGWAALTGDAAQTLDPLFRTPSDGLEHFNRSAYSNPIFDARLQQAERATHPQERIARLADAMRILREDLPAIPLVTTDRLYALRPGIEWEPPIHGHLRVNEVRLARDAKGLARN